MAGFRRTLRSFAATGFVPQGKGDYLNEALRSCSSIVKVLVFNCGSSSLKFASFEGGDTALDRRVRGEIEEIGGTSSRLSLKRGDSNVNEAVAAKDHAEATRIAMEAIGLSSGKNDSPNFIGHRVVHGGSRVVAPTKVDEEVLQELERCSRFAPLHNPAALATIRAVSALLPDIPQAVLTDTAFHHTIPDYAYTYAIPRELAQKHQIRRFGFHGIGHAWMTERYASIAGRPSDSLNLITLQLGAGCSATAIRGGRSVDTSMGLTPLEGLAMATRSGDIDPAIFSYLANSADLTPSEVERLLNHKSGVLGISGASGDMRELMNCENNGDECARLALAVFCYRVRKYIGAYLASPGHTEAIIFGGGIGEHAGEIRARICRGFGHLGIIFDEERNGEMNTREGRFSTEESAVSLWVIPLEEELYIARMVIRLFNSNR
jgi:acetate kinase